MSNLVSFGVNVLSTGFGKDTFYEWDRTQIENGVLSKLKQTGRFDTFVEWVKSLLYSWDLGNPTPWNRAVTVLSGATGMDRKTANVVLNNFAQRIKDGSFGSSYPAAVRVTMAQMPPKRDLPTVGPEEQMYMGDFGVEVFV